MMAVTSQVNSSMSLGEMFINDFASAGLLKPSVIKPVIATVEQIIIRKLGQLKHSDCNKLRELIKSILS